MLRTRFAAIAIAAGLGAALAFVAPSRLLGAGANDKAAPPAEPYDDVARGAQALPSPGALEWTAESCDKASNDLFKRQCLGVRAAAAAAAHKPVYRVAGDEQAVWIGQWDAKKKALPIEVFGCVRCAGEGPFLVAGSGEPKLEAGVLRGPSLVKLDKAFADEAAARTWAEASGKRLRVQFLVNAPLADNKIAAGGRDGFRVTVVGYRVWDACDGQVVAASHPAPSGPRDEAGCKGGKAATSDDAPGPASDAPRLPDTLSTRTIKASLAPAEAAIMTECFGNYGVAGKADVLIVIAKDGTVKSATLKKGKFKDTPTGECIVEQIKAATFPPFSSATMSVTYPIILR